MGYYDIDELSAEARLPRLANECEKSSFQDLTKKRKYGTKDKWMNGNGEISLFHSLPRTLGATTNYFVDFSGTFKDTLNAQAVKMANKSKAPTIRGGQQASTKTAQTQKRTVRRVKKCTERNFYKTDVSNSLLVIANGRLVDFQRDEENKNERLQEMDEHLTTRLAKLTPQKRKWNSRRELRGNFHSFYLSEFLIN